MSIDNIVIFCFGLILIIFGMALILFKSSDGGLTKIKLPVIELEVDGAALFVMILGAGLMYFAESNKNATPGAQVAEQKTEEAAEAQKAAERKAADAEQARKVSEQKAAAAEEAQRAAEQKAAAAQRAAATEAQKAAEQKAADAERVEKTAKQKTAPATEARSVARPEDITNNDVISKFTIKINRDIPGEDIPLLNGQIGFVGLNINVCAAKCASSELCNAFTFDHWNKKCYLKSKIVNSIIDPHSTIAVKNKFEIPRVSQASPEIRIRHNKLFDGSPIARSSVVDFEECETLCEKDMRCVAFSFLKDQKNGQNCEVFNKSENGYFTSNSADSGWKQQAP